MISEGRIGKLGIKLNMPGNNSEIKIENVLIRIVTLRESKATYSREESDPTSREVHAR